jgi:hypothetical protein
MLVRRPSHADRARSAIVISMIRVTAWGRGALLLALAAPAGCASGGDDDRPDAMVFGEQCVPGGSFDLDGRAAVLGALNVHVNASGLVEVDTTAELLIALEVVQEGTHVSVVAEACAIEIPNVPIQGQDQPIVFEVPAETVASVAGVSGNAELSSPDQTCASFESDVFTIVIGAILDPIESANLPAADDDGSFPFCAPTADTTCEIAIGVNCACDQEDDGKGGATLLAYNVPAVDLDQVYVALRTRFSLSGEVFSSDLILGEIDATIEQGILGCRLASGAACNGDQVGAVKNLNPVITQQPGNASTFRSARVEPGESCADIIARRDELFPR